MKEQRSTDRHDSTTSRRQGLGTKIYARADVVLSHHILRTIAGAAPRVRLWADISWL